MRSINGARLSSVLVMVLLAGCTTSEPPAPAAEALAPEVVVKTKIVDNSCKWFQPVYLAPTDILADKSARVIVGNNEAGAQHCGWKPAAK